MYEVDILKYLSSVYNLKIVGYSKVSEWYISNNDIVGCLINHNNAYSLKLEYKNKFIDWDNCSFAYKFQTKEEFIKILDNNMLTNIK